MDPSKRVCIKNIPVECTKRDLADFIRNRTGAQPHSIDLGLDADGRPRRYAHFSVEGAKNVIAALSGATWRDAAVTALPAHPHFTFRLAEARRRREMAEAAEREAVDAFWAEQTARWVQKTGGELRKGKAPKPFYATRQRYAAVAAELAQKLREEHQNRQTTRRAHMAAPSPTNTRPIAQQEKTERAEEEAPSRKVPPPRKQGRGAAIGGAKRRKVENTSKPTVAPPPPEPPQPTKEERKLSGLQAKLAALRAKMK